jgi:hypothetical protein
VMIVCVILVEGFPVLYYLFQGSTRGSELCDSKTTRVASSLLTSMEKALGVDRVIFTKGQQEFLERKQKYLQEMEQNHAFDLSMVGRESQPSRRFILKGQHTRLALMPTFLLIREQTQTLFQNDS